MYHHLPRFVRTFGRETVSNVPVTTLNGLGFMIGLFIGRGIGGTFDLPPWLYLLETVLCSVLGVVLTYDQHEMLVMQRVTLLLAYYRRKLFRQRTADVSAWMVIPVDDDADYPPLPMDVLAFGGSTQPVLPAPKEHV